MSKEQLIAKIKLSNNGYLFAVTANQLHTAGAFLDARFVIAKSPVITGAFKVSLR